jgi:hypothetical protein
MTLDVPNRDIEPAVVTTPGIDYKTAQIRHQPELKSGFAVLAKKVTIYSLVTRNDKTIRQ